MADWTTNKNLIQKLYIAFYGRPADPGGLRYWASQLPDNAAPDSAATKELISRFINSEEAQSRFGNPELNAVIDRVINFAFHRNATDADKQGVNNVVDLLVKVLSVSSGPDYASLNNKLQYANWFVDYLDPNGDGIPNDDATGTKFAATFVGNTDANNVAAKLNFIDAANPPTQVMVLNDIKTVVADPSDEIIVNPPATGKTFVLTTGVDNIQGTAGDDTIIAGEGTAGGTHTLGASDVINGGSGFDTIEIRLADDQTVVPNMQSVERMVVQSVGTKLWLPEVVNMINAKGVQEIVNRNSSDSIQITNLQEKAKLIIEGGNGSDTFVDAATTAARTGDLIIELNSADINFIVVNKGAMLGGGVAGNPSATIIVNGANTINTLELGNTITTLTIKGTGSLEINKNNGVMDEPTLTKIDASQNEGGVILSTNTPGALTFIGGKGNDEITFAPGTLTAADNVDGGDGTLDIIVATQQNLMNAATKIKNFEVISVSDFLTGVIGGDNAANLDASKFSGALVFELQNGYALTGARIDNLNAKQQRVDILWQPAPGVGLEIDDGGTAATDDEFTIGIGQEGVNGAVNAAVTFFSGTIERVNLISHGDPNLIGGNIINLFGGMGNVHTLNISGEEDLTVTTFGSVVQTIDATKASGGVDVTGVVLGGATTFNMGAGADIVQGSNKADTINMGAGNDTVFGSQGADTITLGDGADTVIYSNLNQSNSAATDTIVDFVSGTDKIDLAALGVTQYVGTKASFALAQGALPGGGVVAAVFQADENRLWVDMDGNGTLDANDFRVVLQGVTNLAATSVITGAGTTLIANAAPFNTITGVGIQGGLTASALANNTIKANNAQISAAGTVIDGVGGTNTLVVTDDAAAIVFPAGIANIAAIQLADGSSANANMPNLVGLTITNTSAKAATVTLGNVPQTYNGGTNTDVVTLGAAGQTVNAGDGADVVNTTAANLANAILNFGAGNDVLNVTTAGTVNLLGGAGNTTVSGLENVILTGASTLKANIAGLNVTVGTGNTTITNNGATQTVVATALDGNDLTLDGSATTLVQDLEDNGSDVTVAAGAGTTTIEVDVTGGPTVHTITNNSTNLVTVDATGVPGGGNNTVTLTGTGNFLVKDAGGANGLQITVAGGSSGNINLTSLDGALTLAAGGTGSVTVDAADLAAGNAITLTGAQAVTINNLNLGDLAAAGGTGSYTVAIGNTATGGQTVTTGTGVDAITLQALAAASTGNVKIETGKGADTVTIGNNAAAVTLDYTTLATRSSAVNGVDVITGFRAGSDSIDVATVPLTLHGAASNNATTTATLAATITTVVAGIAGFAGNDAALITLTNYNGGNAVFLFVDDDGNAAFTNTDTLVQLVGTIGVITTADLV